MLLPKTELDYKRPIFCAERASVLYGNGESDGGYRWNASGLGAAGILLTGANGQQTLLLNNPTLVLDGTVIRIGFAGVVGHRQAINDWMWAKVVE
jgi:hypothetical protein